MKRFSWRRNVSPSNEVESAELWKSKALGSSNSGRKTHPHKSLLANWHCQFPTSLYCQLISYHLYLDCYQHQRFPLLAIAIKVLLQWHAHILCHLNTTELHLAVIPFIQKYLLIPIQKSYQKQSEDNNVMHSLM